MTNRADIAQEGRSEPLTGAAELDSLVDIIGARFYPERVDETQGDSPQHEGLS